jgi:hypothetical protein
MRRGFRAVRTFTCPNHPGGPPTLPADGYEREEMTLEEAYEPTEVAALEAVVDAAAGLTTAENIDTVRAMFGLCCTGHRWKITGFRATTHSEETVASMFELLRNFVPIPFPPILLAELEHFDVQVQPGHPLPIRIPLIRDDGDTSPDG